ncbi:hypothetical protein ACW9IB_24160 [Pseudomonas sp. SDO524_S393]
MQRPLYDAMSSRTRSSCREKPQYYRLDSPFGCPNSVLYQVVPAGKNFFHILEVNSGRIKGFRSDHIQACELAKELEATLQASYGARVAPPG